MTSRYARPATPPCVSTVTDPDWPPVTGSYAPGDSPKGTIASMIKGRVMQLLTRVSAGTSVVASVGAFLTFAAIAAPASAGNDMFETESGILCGDRGHMLAEIEQSLGANTISRGFTAQGTVIEVVTGNDGGWSMIETSHSGITCLVASGSYWQRPANSARTEESVL